jgi:hypothetical protein
VRGSVVRTGRDDRNDRSNITIGSIETYHIVAELRNALEIEPAPLPKGLLINTGFSRVRLFGVVRLEQSEGPKQMNRLWCSDGPLLRPSGPAEHLPDEGYSPRANAEEGMEAPKLSFGSGSIGTRSHH